MRVPIRCRWFHGKYHRHVTDGGFMKGACLKCLTEFACYGSEKKWPAVTRDELTMLFADEIYRQHIVTTWGGSQSVRAIDILRHPRAQKEIRAINNSRKR